MVGDHNLQLACCVTLKRGTTYQSSRLGEPGPVLLGLASITPEGGFRGSDLKTYGGTTAESILLRPGDLYVSLKDVTQSGSLLGAVARVPSRITTGRLTQDTVKLTPRPGAPSPNYLYWILRTPEYRQYCRERAIGTTNLALSRLDFLAFRVPVATSERLFIAELLTKLDERIELNHHQASTLEAMVQMLFKSWFVDFDPVHAKVEGHATGLSDELAAQFPSEFGMDGRPLGWTERPLAELFDVNGGNTPKTAEEAFWDGAHEWATPRDLSGLYTTCLLATGRRLTDAGLAQASSGLLPSGSLLLSTRAPIGYMGFVTRPTAINQGLAGIVRKDVSPAYAWGWAHAHMPMIVSNANGSTFPEISKAVLRSLPMLAPPQPVLDAFGTVADALVQRIVAATQQARTLADVRDALLFKLISGELRIGDTKHRVAAA